MTRIWVGLRQNPQSPWLQAWKNEFLDDGKQGIEVDGIGEASLDTGLKHLRRPLTVGIEQDDRQGRVHPVPVELADQSDGIKRGRFGAQYQKGGEGSWCSTSSASIRLPAFRVR